MNKVFASGCIGFMLLATSLLYAGFEHTIVDVTDGKITRGIATPSDANGYALGSFDGIYSLNAEFFNLSDPLGDDFYEGWLVRRDPFDFISTGNIEKGISSYSNIFSSNEDYTDYDFYVVTLEPNDNDPAPAEHIIEGEVVFQATDDIMISIQTVNEQEQKVISPREKLIRSAITEKLTTLDIDSNLLLERVMSFRDSLESRGLSASKQAAYMELLDILIEILKEKTMMQK